MSRLLIHVEGPTEEAFVNEVLRPHLFAHGYQSVSARILGHARLRERRGGIKSWASVKKEIANHLREDPHCVASTMVDFYALPQSEQRAWPGREDASQLSGEAKALHVEGGMLTELIEELGSGFDPKRFVPFIVLHEFEGLLFSDCNTLSEAIYRPDLKEALRGIRNEFQTPEDINDSPETAPSKRLIELLPGYQKPLLGPLAALEIGLTRIREECPHFQSWVTQLESLLQKD